MPEREAPPLFFDASLGLAGDGPASSRTVTITDRHCVGLRDQRFLFGGVGSALCIETLRQTLGREVCAFALQFVEPTRSGEDLRLEVVRANGRAFQQAAIEGRVGDRLVLAGLASLGSIPHGLALDSPPMPQTPPPLDCPLALGHAHAHEDAHSRMEIRLARGRYGVFSKAPPSGDRHVLFWMRPANGPLHVTHLAMAADFLPSTASDAFATRAGGSSLDNSFRLIDLAPTDWALCHLAIRGAHDGVAHGSVEIWAQDGRLMALGSQSFLPRLMGKAG